MGHYRCNCFGPNIFLFLLQENFYAMLDYQTQKKLLQPILKNPKNRNCADCDSIAPTWASLDFGVFLCSNCSGAHRSLGPTVTRVRSANLDKWQEEWLSNMRIGNSELNCFWQSDPQAINRKPKNGAALNEIARYVFQKYVKRKFVKDSFGRDPLTLYKNGQYDISNGTNKPKAQVKPVDIAKPVEVPKPVELVKANSAGVSKKNDICLLDFDLLSPPVTVQAPVVQQPLVQQDNFTIIANPTTSTVDPLEKATDANFITFDALLSQHKPVQTQPIHHSHSLQSYQVLKAQNLQMHHPYNPQLAQHNLVYQGHYQQYPQHRAYGSGGHNVGGVQTGVGYVQGTAPFWV